MRFLSVCSGIEAASAAWEPFGWRPLALSEIEPFPRSVLEHRLGAVPTDFGQPWRDGSNGVPLFGDFTRLRDEPWIGAADLLVGGTPCQAFSVAGARRSLADERGNLTLEYVRLANAIDDLRLASGRPPAWIVWENVPGVLSVGDNAFGAFLAGLVGGDAALVSRGGWSNAGVVAGPRRVAAWRILDAQHFGVAQRRRRVFVVARGNPRGWAAPDALLPIGESVSGHPKPCREPGAHAFADPGRNPPRGRYLGTAEGGDPDGLPFLTCSNIGKHVGTQTPLVSFDPLAFALRGREGGAMPEVEGEQVGAPLVAVPILEVGKRTGTSTTDPRAGIGIGDDGDPMFTLQAGAQHGVAFALRGREGGAQAEVEGEQVGALRAASGGSSRSYVAFSCKDFGADEGDLSPTLRAMGGNVPNGGGQVAVATASGVRRLTPRECERLQGFPDDWTLVPHRGKPASACPDGPRYKALGNSMAVPVMRHIGAGILRALEREGSQ